MQLVYDELLETTQLEDFNTLMTKYLRIDQNDDMNTSIQKHQTEEANVEKDFVRNEYGENVASHHFALDARPKVVIQRST